MSGEGESSAWVCKANDAISINLVASSPEGLRSVAIFHPKFTYPLFGDDEEIFGYKDLRVNLRYRTNDMRPHVKISWGKRLKGDSDREITNIQEILEDGGHIPKVGFVKETDFEDSSRQLGDKWSPPGTLLSTMPGPDCTYEVWQGTLADDAVAQLHKRVQIMVPLLIEGGSYIGHSETSESVSFDYSDGDRWTVFFLYQKEQSPETPDKSTYTFMGYSTVYRFFFFQPTPPPSPSDEWELPAGEYDLSDSPCRTRLSQFIILPPFQGKGNGIRLYDAIFKHYYHHEQTKQFAVENPNEAFDDLRDVYDLGFLRTIPEFAALKIDTQVSIPKTGPVPKLITASEGIEAIRAKSKIVPRQFSRVLEMHLMSQLPSSVQMTMTLDEKPKATAEEAKQHREWQLIVKQRLYRHNRDLLSQLDADDRIDKLAETLIGVELEYARLLAAYERGKSHNGLEPSPGAVNGKRKLNDSGRAHLVRRLG